MDLLLKILNSACFTPIIFAGSANLVIRIVHYATFHTVHDLCAAKAIGAAPQPQVLLFKRGQLKSYKYHWKSRFVAPSVIPFRCYILEVGLFYIQHKESSCLKTDIFIKRQKKCGHISTIQLR